MKLPFSFMQEQVSLSMKTSWMVGGNAEVYALPSTIDELIQVWEWGTQNCSNVTVLSGGTNVLVSDEGIKGLVIHLKKLSGLVVEESKDRIRIEALAGTAKSELLRTFLKYKLAPAVFLAGIPGDVGGGVVMNAGVGENILPREFVEIVDWVDILRDGQIKRLQKKDLTWSYRHCTGWEPGVIVKVGISWPKAPSGDVLKIVKDANAKRHKSQPLEWPSCGSVFVNPPGQKSGELIESCGLKGFKIGGAQVSEKHANFIVNTGSAKAIEIDQIIKHVQKTVFEQRKVALRTEVIYLGDW